MTKNITQVVGSVAEFLRRDASVFSFVVSIAIGVREIVDLHSHVCDVAFYATSTLAVDAAHFVLLPLSCDRLPTSLVHASGAVLLLELKVTFANGY